MSKVLELREKRAKAWEAAKAFLDAKRTDEGFVSAEDAATYDKMEADVVNLGKEIERLERQASIDAELAKAIREVHGMTFRRVFRTAAVLPDRWRIHSLITYRDRSPY